MKSNYIDICNMFSAKKLNDLTDQQYTSATRDYLPLYVREIC